MMICRRYKNKNVIKISPEVSMAIKQMLEYNILCKHVYTTKKFQKTCNIQAIKLLSNGNQAGTNTYD